VGGVLIPSNTSKGYEIAHEGDSVNLDQPNSKTRRGRVGKEKAQTLTTSCNQGVVTSAKGVYLNDSEAFHRKPLNELSRCLKSSNHDAGIIENNFRIRKLTPLECWRLMGIDDEYYRKARKGLLEITRLPNSQLYKQAGNGIVVDVMEHIFKQMIEEKP
jgi:Site-specific DNA methylase